MSASGRRVRGGSGVPSPTRRLRPEGRVRRARRRAPVLAAGVLALLLAAGCGPGFGRGPTRHAEGGGPLGAMGESGGVSIFPEPGYDQATFGSLLFCLHQDAGPVRLVAIRPVEPVGSGTRATTVVRRVAAWDGDAAGGAPYISSMGAPPLLEGERMSGEIGPVAGLTVEQPCGEQGTGAPFVEGMAVFPVAGGGSWGGAEVEYVAGSRTYILEVDWEFVVCGPDVAEHSLCRGYEGGTG